MESTHQPAADHDVDSQRALQQRIADLEQRLDSYRLSRDAWTLIILAFAALALVASIIALGAAMRAIDEAEQAASMLLPLAGIHPPFIRPTAGAAQRDRTETWR